MLVYVITYSVKFPYEGEEVLGGTFGVASTPDNARQMMAECRDHYYNFDCEVEMESFELDD